MTEPTIQSSLGSFSLSLAVADLQRSIDFYTTLGFVVTGGDDETWAILVNHQTVIGLFLGMFEDNLLTFNPGWGVLGAELDEFDDVRVLRQRLIDAGLEVKDDQTTMESTDGPASFVVVDPDGNPILFDQHR